MPVVSPSCYDLLGVPVEAPQTDIRRAWTDRRADALDRLNAAEDDDVEALVARLDEAYAILSDPVRAQRYRLYRDQTSGDRKVEPTDFPELNHQDAPGQEDEIIAISDDFVDSPTFGRALGRLAEVVLASPAPEAADSQAPPPGPTPDDLAAPWTTRKSSRKTARNQASPRVQTTSESTPAIDALSAEVAETVPHDPPPRMTAEAALLPFAEVQARVVDLQEHLAAAEMVRRERSDLLRQNLDLRTETERRSAESTVLRQRVLEAQQETEATRERVEAEREVRQQAEERERRIAKELADAQGATQAVERQLTGSRAELEQTRARVAQLEERLTAQEEVIGSERSLQQNLRKELTAAGHSIDKEVALHEQTRVELKDVRRELVSRVTRLEIVETTLGEREEALSQTRGLADDRAEELRLAGVELEVHKRAAEEARVRMETAQQREATLEKTVVEHRQDAEQARTARSDAEARYLAVTEQLSAEQKTHQGVRSDLDELRVQLQDQERRGRTVGEKLKARESELSASIELLETVRADLASRDDSVASAEQRLEVNRRELNTSLDRTGRLEEELAERTLALEVERKRSADRWEDHAAEMRRLREERDELAGQRETLRADLKDVSCERDVLASRLARKAREFQEVCRERDDLEAVVDESFVDLVAETPSIDGIMSLAKT